MKSLKLFKIRGFYNNYFVPIFELFKKSNVSKNKILLVVILTILGSFLEAFFILLLGPFTNSILNSNTSSGDNLSLLGNIYNSPFLILLLIIFVLFSKSTISTFTSYYVTKIISIIRKNLRIKLIDSVINTSWKSKIDSGKLLDAYLSSTSTAVNSIFYVTDILTYSLYVLAVLATLLLKVSFDLIIVFIFLGIFYYLSIYFLSKQGRDLSFINLKTNQKLSQLASETLLGIREIQIFGIQDILINQMSAEENKLVKNESKTALLRKTPTVLPSILITFIIIYGYFSRGTDDISSNSTIVVTALVAVQRLGVFVSVIGQKLTMIGTGTAEMNFILKQIKNVTPANGQKITISEKENNTISISNLTFNYGDSNQLLRDLNVDFCSGKVSVIAGPSGSGKSSLFSLLLKECNPLSGKIKFNNFPLDKISKNSWYENLSFVSQSPFIFETSIFNNIRIGREDATLEEVKNASKIAGSLEYINRLSNKFKFNVADGGTNLSGGQCQLISLTRAILKNSPIVFLDEPSNNLDKKSIIKLKNLFLSWAKENKLVVIITHDQRLIDKRFDIYNVKDFNLFKQIDA